MSSNAPKEDVQHSLPQPELCGWTKNNDGSYVFDWECPSVQKLVKETITFLTKGCSCKKGCTSQRCGCRKGGHSCGPACSCQNCTNVLQLHGGNDINTAQPHLQTLMNQTHTQAVTTQKKKLKKK